MLPIFRPLALALLLTTASFATEDEGLPFAPTSSYEVRTIEGWTVRVHRGFLRGEPELAGRTLRLLEIQLYQITRVVPEPALEKLRQVGIWVEESEGHHPCMAYHPAEGWLIEHGMNPEKARCVEVADARNFLEWTIAQPWMVLHELAHAYHDQFLEGGFDNAEVRAAFEEGARSGRYDSVPHIDGREHRAYALTNPMEFFAEASEAYFGTNDFFPFVRSELRRHDPDAFDRLKSLWGAR